MMMGVDDLWYSTWCLCLFDRRQVAACYRSVAVWCSQCKDKHWNKWRWRKLLIISVLIEKVAHYQSQRGKRIKFSCRHGYGMERTRAYILNKIYWHFFIVCREFTIYYNDINTMNLTLNNSHILQINVKNGWI